MKVKELVQLLIELPQEADELEIFIEYDGPDAHSERSIGGLMYDGQAVVILETGSVLQESD